MRVGDNASTIRDVATEVRAGLIAMCTHGRSGLSRWALGSTADLVGRLAAQPVLLTRPGLPPLPEPPHRILVPLDGTLEAETALDHAQALARAQRATLILFRAADAATEEEPTGHGVFRARRTHDVEAYLEGLRLRLRLTGTACEVQVGHQPPAKAILQAAEAAHADLIVMATHGRGGLARLIHGSVSTSVLHSVPCPLLLVRAAPVQSEEAVAGSQPAIAG